MGRCGVLRGRGPQRAGACLLLEPCPSNSCPGSCRSLAWRAGPGRLGSWGRVDVRRGWLGEIVGLAHGADCERMLRRVYGTSLSSYLQALESRTSVPFFRARFMC